MSEEKHLSKFKNIFAGKSWLLLLLALALLLLLFGTDRAEQKKTAETSSDVHARTEAYRQQLEGELAALCERLSGVGNVQVMITLDGTERAVYAADARGDGKSDYVVSGGQGLLIAREYPAVVGVAIVCDGGGSNAVREELARLASAALGIGLNRIYVGST
jgi:stage III sporulation protein AG